jgi:flagellar motor switch/type III secretory pathway protein FliN
MIEIPTSRQTLTNAAVASALGRPMSAVEMLPWLPCTLALEVPLVNFTVEHLLKLQPGSLVYTGCHQSSDLPLNVNNILMAWTEFEVVGDRLAARITDLV